MFSDRTNWSLQNNPLSLAIEALKKQGMPFTDLTESNPTRCGFTYPSHWLSLLSGPQNLLYLPESQGMEHARQAVAQYYAQRKLKLDPAQFILTSSTSEGYSFLLKLLANPGDHVLIPKPSYPLFQFLLELHDVEFDYYPLVYTDHWHIDQEAFKALVTSKTKAVIVVNPNNPTCSFTPPHDEEFLNQQCIQHSMAIISDEVFLDYSLDVQSRQASLAGNTKALTFTLSGISKILALPQMKLSWIAVNGPEALTKPALEKLDVIADTYLSVNTPVQNALPQWLFEATLIQQQILERVKGNLEILRRGIDLPAGRQVHHAPSKVLNVEGGWYAVLEVPQLHSEEDFILKLLQEDRILVHPGFFFDFDKEGYLVVSLLPEPAIFAKAIEQILRKIKKL